MRGVVAWGGVQDKGRGRGCSSNYLLRKQALSVNDLAIFVPLPTLQNSTHQTRQQQNNSAASNHICRSTREEDTLPLIHLGAYAHPS